LRAWFQTPERSARQFDNNYAVVPSAPVILPSGVDEFIDSLLQWCHLQL